MCVRELTRGKCQVSTKTSTAKLRRSNKVSLPQTSNKRPRKMKREEELDLFCTERLAQGEPHSYHSDISYFKIEGDTLSPLVVDIPSAFCGAVDPYVYSVLMSPESCNYFQQRTWTGVERGPSPFGYAEEIAVGAKSGDYRAGDDRQWSDEGLLDGVVWHEFSPEQHFSFPVATYDIWECVEAETYLPFGKSLQCNSLPCEQWAAKTSGLSSVDKEPTESIVSSRSRKKIEFSVSAETFNDDSRTNYHERDRSTSRDLIKSRGVTNNSLCTLEFWEAMDFLLEKESTAIYQLSKVYLEKLTANSEQKLGINSIRTIRRNFVKWILKVVEHLQLSSLTAAHAVSLFDRILSLRLSLDAQVEDDDELLLAATACVWIAAKLEDSSVPHLSCIQALVTVGFDDVKFRKIEAVVLSSLGWRTFGVTASDFLANMIARLPELGVPAHLLTSLGCRSEEVMRVLLSEVEFLAYQPSVVSFSVMQYLLDESVPVQTASLMAAFHLALAVDVVYTSIQKTITGEISMSIEKRILNDQESREDCNRAIKNLVKQTQVPVLQSPPRACAKFKKCNDLQSDSSNVD